MALNFGTLIARRLERIYRKIGRTLTIVHGLGSELFTGRVSYLVFDEMSQQFPASEYATWQRPSYKVQVAGDFRTANGGPFVGDTVDLPNDNLAYGAVLTYTVRQTERSVFADVVYRTTIYLSRT